MDFEPQPFQLLSIVSWLIACTALLCLGLGISFLAMLLSRGKRGVVLWAEEVVGMLQDVFSVSPRRVLALAQLTLRESVRRKALLVFVVFALLFMFAGWFLSSTNLQPEFQVKIYVSFVLRTISWLMLPVVLLLSCWGIPEDIKVRSLHTVVTKPVRRLEIVLGRMLGYGGVAVLVLAVMSAVGWGWIRRQLPEDAQKQLICRQPVYGSLKFIDREGNEAAQGINTGDIWGYRSYIEGATKARAIWSFANVTADLLDKDGNLQLENSFQGFRSHKGDMRRSLYYQYVLVNPESKLRVPLPLKTIREFRGITDPIARSLPRVAEADDADQAGGAEARAYDLINDVVSRDGRLDVEVLCIDPGQYIGMARQDLFIRTPDAPFEAGYFKAVAGIGLMSLLVVVLGVTVSTFVKGPVATFLTLCLVIIGQSAHEFMGKLVYGMEQGGGMLESIYRIKEHLNPQVPLPEGPATTVMQTIDAGVMGFMWLIFQIIPDFKPFDMAPFVANGFDVRWDAALLPSLMTTLGYFFPCLLLGYFCLRIRELEAK